MLEFRSLSLDYRGRGGAVPAAAAVDAVVPTGGICSLLGPSGCGKTSLIHAAAGLLSPAAGEVLVEGERVRGVRRRTAVIFQDYGLLPWRTVAGNAELPLVLQGFGRRERRRRTAPILEELGLASFAHFYPHQLSGGMKQRLAVARALSAEPDLLLMDEPFSSLDALTREAAQDFLLEVRRRRPLSILAVTHSVEEAVYLSERVFVMGGRNPGTIIRTIDIPENRAELRFGGAAGVVDFRARPRFHELCAELREALRESAAHSAAATVAGETEAAGSAGDAGPGRAK